MTQPLDPDFTLHEVTAGSEIETVRQLFLEYEQELGVSLCFQGFAAELAALPGEYTPPGGRLVLARYAGAPAGCIALRRIDDRVCEMKRLYLRPSGRGRGRGLHLVTDCLAAARRAGYERMRLDTLPQMQAAISMYRALGFHDIAPYRDNPVPGALYLEIDLTAVRDPGGRS